MRIFIYILLAIVAFLVVLCYSLCAIASEADEQMERWEYERSNSENDE